MDGVMLAASDQTLSLIVFWLIVGGVAGWLASLVARTGDRMGCLLNIAVGVVGAVIGGWLFRNLGIKPPAGHPYLGSILVSFVGALILLLLLRLLSSLRR